VVLIIEIEMHWSSGYYNDDSFIPPPLDSRCCNCPFMPDNVCGGGYQELGECVFILDPGTQYWYNAYDDCLNEKFNDYVLKPEEGIEALVHILDMANQLHTRVDEWNYESQRHGFLDRTWLLRKKIEEYGYEVKTEFDYVIDSYSDAPCAICGKITEKFVLHGSPRWFGSNELEGKVIKLCEHCADVEWMASYMR